jgi:hypothetical protein
MEVREIDCEDKRRVEITKDRVEDGLFDNGNINPWNKLMKAKTYVTNI